MIEQLKSRGYCSDPVKAWKQSFKMRDEEEGEEDAEEEESQEQTKAPDYSYLLSMQLLSLTWEEKEKLLTNRNKKVCSYHVMVM